MLAIHRSAEGVMLAAGDAASAEGEDGDDSDEGGVLHAEAKTFSWHPLEDLCLLRESHKRWKREICLSTEQLCWISEELRGRSIAFGFTKRKVSKSFKDGVVLMVEGKNQWGVFISVEVRDGSLNSEYVIIPAGVDGRHWGRFARWLRDVFLPDRNHSATQHSVRDSCQMAHFSSHQSRSYADAVRSVSSEDYCTMERNVALLGQKLDTVLGELSRIQSSRCSPFSGENGKAPLPIKEGAKPDSTLSLPGCDGDLLFWNFSDEAPVSWKGSSLTWEEMCGGDESSKSPKGSVVNSSDQAALLGLVERDDRHEDHNFNRMIIAGSIEATSGIVDNLESLAFHKEEDDGTGDFEFQMSDMLVVASLSEVVKGNRERTELFEYDSSGEINGKVGSHNEVENGIGDCNNVVCSNVGDHCVDTSWGSDKIFDVGSFKTFSLKDMLREVESTMDFDNLPHGKGRSVLIEGDYFDGATIFESLKPPTHARVSKIAFKLWRRHVGRPLLKKLRHYGVDVSLDLYEKAPT